MSLKHVYATFESLFHNEVPPRLFFAPGRINLIGEHTDYNGGYVFPAAISYGTYVLASKRPDSLIRFYSMNLPEFGVVECQLDDLIYEETHGWVNYPKGIIQYVSQHHQPITTGMDILYYGDIPHAAGLSSSASVEMATTVMLEGLFSIKISRLEMIQLGQKVENEYIGVQSGIMDQFAIGMGKAGHAIHLHTDTLAYTYAPLQLADHTIVIIHTNKNRSLSDSKYNERREQCEEALKNLQTILPVKNLGEVTPAMFRQYKTFIAEPVHRKRAQHVVFENDRTKQALEKLTANDLEGFGLLMNDSHLSLKNDYEVTGEELDTIVEAAWQQKGVIGARMTGAGFGGCAIAIVHHHHVQSVMENVAKTYKQQIGYEPSFYTPNIADGAKELTKEVIR